MFILKGEPASVHDFSLYQKNIKIYSLYLKATKKDRELGLKEQEYWDLLLDKGYIGEVPGRKESYNKIVPKKSNMKGYSAKKNLEINQ